MDKPGGFLKTLRLRNILSFGPDGVDIELHPMNILIGPNTAGKSNFIEILALLRSLPRDLASHIRGAGGVRELVWKGSDSKKFPELEVVVESLRLWPPWKTCSLHYFLSFWDAAMHPAISCERVEDAGESAMPYYTNSMGNAVVYSSDALSSEPEGVAKREKRQLSISSESVLAQLRDFERYPELTALGQFFVSIYLMREGGIGHLSGARLPERADLPTDFLLEDGSNLGLILNDLQNRPAVWRQVTECLKDVYPDLDYINAKVYSGHVEVVAHQKGLSAPIPAQRLSDGTLRYLCLLCVLCHPEPPPVICIEEPELGLHPDMIHKVAELLREASERTQLIVTTHSDILVSAFKDHPEAIVVCERDEDGTHMRRLERERLKEWLEEYSLGDLWISGEIGGTRW